MLHFHCNLMSADRRDRQTYIMMMMMMMMMIVTSQCIRALQALLLHVSVSTQRRDTALTFRLEHNVEQLNCWVRAVQLIRVDSSWSCAELTLQLRYLWQFCLFTTVSVLQLLSKLRANANQIHPHAVLIRHHRYLFLPAENQVVIYKDHKRYTNACCFVGKS